MAELTLKRVTITTRDGSGIVAKALLAVCECGSVEWNCYQVEGQKGYHMHLQCLKCSVTYCDGSCTWDNDPIAFAE